MRRLRWLLEFSVLLGGIAAAHAQSDAGTPPDAFAIAGRIFADFCLDAHIPGLLYGIVADGRLVDVATFGVQELESRRPVTPDTGVDRPVPVGPELASAYRVAGAIYAAGDVAAGRELLAMNFLLDRSAEGWARDLAKLKAQIGECDASAPLTASGALSGDFTWHCTHGRVQGSLELAPTRPPRIQQLQFAAMTA